MTRRRVRSVTTTGGSRADAVEQLLVGRSPGTAWPCPAGSRAACEILGRGLGALLTSDPCSPIGKVAVGEELAAWVSAARELDCAMLFDEFYSGSLGVAHPEPADATVRQHVGVAIAPIAEDVV